jgi:Protein of unknown function (DUF2845)
MKTRCRLFLCALLLLAIAPAAHAMRCGSRLTSNGDHDFQVRDRCGEPYWVEDHYRLIVTGADSPVQNVQQIVYTAWFYNFGPSRLMVRMLFRDGRLVREETLGYGVNNIGDSCSPTKLLSGMSSGELVAYCGQPLSRNGQPGATLRRVGPGTYSENDNYLEDWVYDLGSDFLYVMHLRNGHTESVEHVHR